MDLPKQINSMQVCAKEVGACANGDPIEHQTLQYASRLPESHPIWTMGMDIWGTVGVRLRFFLRTSIVNFQGTAHAIDKAVHNVLLM
eukprot:5392789-Amphidinium_carterae.1